MTRGFRPSDEMDVDMARLVQVVHCDAAHRGLSNICIVGIAVRVIVPE